MNQLTDGISKLFQSGKLIQIHVRKWSMAVSLNKEDLSLTDVPDFVVLGHKRLISAEEIHKFVKVENGARIYLRNKSLPFPISHAHFVPNKILPQVVEKLQQFKTEFDQVTETFLQNYEVHKNAMLEKYEGQQEVLRPYYPTTEVLRSKFSFNISLFEIAMPSEMKETTLAEIQAEDEARQELKAKFEHIYQEQYDKSVEQVNDFLREAVLASRKKVIDSFQLIANKLAKGEVVSATNLKTITNVVNLFDQLDFLNDQAVRTELNKVKAELETNADFKEDAVAKEALSVALNGVLHSARNVSDIDSVTGEYMRSLEI